MKNGTYDSLYSYASKNCLGVHPKINWYAIAKFNFTRTIGALDKTVTVIWQFYPKKAEKSHKSIILQQFWHTNGMR